jgi:hypothetical protein
MYVSEEDHYICTIRILLDILLVWQADAGLYLWCGSVKEVNN